MRLSFPIALAGVLAVLVLSACAPVQQRPEVAPAGAAALSAIPYRKGGYPSLAPLLRGVTPSVVNISVESTVSLEEHPFFRDPDFRRFLEKFDLPLPEEPSSGHRQSVGSGFVIDAERGYVLTNRHVIEDAESITVTFRDRGTYRARLIGSDRRADIAVLGISPVPATTSTSPAAMTASDVNTRKNIATTKLRPMVYPKRYLFLFIILDIHTYFARPRRLQSTSKANVSQICPVPPVM